MKTFPPTLGLLLLLSGQLPAQDTPPAAPAIAAPPVLAWGRQWGTPANDFGSALVVDRGGRCFIAGNTSGDLAAKNAGQNDLFVAAFDPEGQRLWAVQLGSAGDDAAKALALAPDGSLYVGGTTAGKLGPAPSGGRDVFIAKLDPDGRVLWLQQFGSAANDTCGALTSDAHGNVFLTGATEGKMGARHFGGADAFLIKVDSAGALVWTCQWGTEGADVSRGLTADADGNLYATGSTSGSLDGPANAGDIDVFVSRIDVAGKLSWSRQFGTSAPDQGMNVRLDSAGRIYIAGSSGGDLAAPQRGGGDSVLLTLSPTGELLWKKQFGTARWDGIHGIGLSTDGAEHVIVGGCQNWDQCQGFLREFDPAGRELWATMIPSEQTICGTQIAIDAQGDIYQTGGTHGAAFGEYHGSDNDIILVKFTAQRRPAVPTGPYFGQSSPGKTPQIFAPGILSRTDRLEARIAFSPDGTECFFTVPNDFTFSNVQIYSTKRVGEVWTPQVLAPFALPGHSNAQPFFSADGSRLYFTSYQTGTRATGIWVTERTAQGWSEPRLMPSPVNAAPSGSGEYSQTLDGTAYFESDRPGGLGLIDVWRARPQSAGQPMQLENLGAAINTSTYDSDPFVSPDGSCLIFSSNRPGGRGGADLYVALADGHGGWTAPANLNEHCPGINTEAIEYGASLSPDGHYLFFVRLDPGTRQCDVWWVENPCRQPATPEPANRSA